MRERPILFSGPMVRAILGGRKTQTRRIVKPQSIRKALLSEGWMDSSTGKSVRCPYGALGTMLWVRETWAAPHPFDGHAPRNIPADARYHYAATEGRGGLLWRPSIHMPRWASRITLEITAVRVERLQEISEADAIAEGVTIEDRHKAGRCTGEYFPPAIRAYRELWEQINGSGPWDVNPWVWCITFKRQPL